MRTKTKLLFILSAAAALSAAALIIGPAQGWLDRGVAQPDEGTASPTSASGGTPSVDRSFGPDDVAGLDAAEALSIALHTDAEKRSFTSWATVDAIHFAFSSGEERAVPLPAGQSLIAVAPYRQQTHPCSIHYIGGCRGELTDSAFDVKIESESGKIVAGGRYTTKADGFLYIWVPRGTVGELHVSGELGDGAAGIDTRKNGTTCITDLKLG